MLPAPNLTAATGAEIYVKYENLQVTNSFKDRGAFVKLASLSETERKRGVIAISAGNHAQAVAYRGAAEDPSHDRDADDDTVREGSGNAIARRGRRVGGRDTLGS